MSSVSCVIPAYNEERRIGAVLEVVSRHPLIGEIIVVDDGSGDGTARVASQFENVRPIVHAVNRGKSAAAHTGISASKGAFVLLLDADLVGLNEENITRLIEPVIKGRADMSLSLVKNAPWLWHTIGLDYISGQRVFAKNIIQGDLDTILTLPGFSLEVFLNARAIRQRSRIAVVPWPNVDNIHKSDKYGAWNGIKSNLEMARDIVQTVSVIGPVYQIVRMLTLRVRTGERSDQTMSFVIPAHNEERHIGRCLQSVLDELARGNYKAEVIVVNNASTDRTQEVARSFAGVRVVGEPEKGLTRARRAGFLASTGELVANLDADTVLPDGWIDTVMREFAADKTLAALSGPFIYYDLSRSLLMLVKAFYFAGYLIHLFNQYVLRKGAMLQGGNFIVRRSALEAIGGYDTSITFYGEDIDIARRISAVGTVKWTFRLPIYASARRLKQEGIVTAGIRYALNYFWVLYRRRPLTLVHRDIRE